jgi:flagellar M-ring protein FliF
VETAALAGPGGQAAAQAEEEQVKIDPVMAAMLGSNPHIRSATQGDASLIADLTEKLDRAPQRRLEQMVDFDEEQAAAILKQWLREGEAA